MITWWLLSLSRWFFWCANRQRSEKKMCDRYSGDETHELEVNCLEQSTSLIISEDKESSALCGKEKIDFGLNSSFYSCCNCTQESHFILHREKLKTRNRGCILMKERGGGKIHINDVTRCALQWAHGWPNMWSRSDDVFKARRANLKHAQNSPLNVFHPCIIVSIACSAAALQLHLDEIASKI